MLYAESRLKTSKTCFGSRHFTAVSDCRMLPSDGLCFYDIRSSICSYHVQCKIGSKKAYLEPKDWRRVGTTAFPFLGRSSVVSFISFVGCCRFSGLWCALRLNTLNLVESFPQLLRQFHDFLWDIRSSRYILAGCLIMGRIFDRDYQWLSTIEELMGLSKLPSGRTGFSRQIHAFIGCSFLHNHIVLPFFNNFWTFL